MNSLLLLAADATTICGQIPVEITNITSLIYTAIKIGIPVLLVLFGMFDFGKSVMAGEEKEIKASQKLFIKRLISAAAVFLVLSIVQLLLSLIGADEGIIGCVRLILGAN